MNEDDEEEGMNMGSGIKLMMNVSRHRTEIIKTGVWFSG